MSDDDATLIALLAFAVIDIPSNVPLWFKGLASLYLIASFVWTVVDIGKHLRRIRVLRRQLRK